MILRFRPTGAWIYLSIAPALAFIAANVDRNYQTDLYHHLARGREIVSQREILSHDIFTCTVAGKQFQDPNWLSQVCFFGLYQGGGLPLLQAANAFVLATVVGLIVLQCWNACGSSRLSGCLGVFNFLGLWQLILIRPQTFSLLLFVMMYLILDAAAKRPWLLWLPPLLMALWVNVHGAFPLGLVLIGVFLLAQVVEVVLRSPWTAVRGLVSDRMTRGLALCLAAGFFATLGNPYGWKIYQYVGMTSATAAGRQIEEWLMPSPHGKSWLIGKIWVMSLMLVLVSLALSSRRPTIRELCLLLCFLPLSCTAVRMVAWWLMIATPIIAAQLAAGLPRAWLEDPDEPRPSGSGDGQPLPDGRGSSRPPAISVISEAAIWGFMVLAMVLSLPGLERYNPLLRWRGHGPRLEEDLERVTHHLEESGRIFSRFEWGEYLEWKLHPRYQVFVDGRIEIYPDEVWNHYEAVSYAREDWQEILDSYRVDHLVLDQDQHRLLLPRVERSPVWERIVEEGPVVLFARRRR